MCDPSNVSQIHPIEKNPPLRIGDVTPIIDSFDVNGRMPRSIQESDSIKNIVSTIIGKMRPGPKTQWASALTTEKLQVQHITTGLISNMSNNLTFHHFIANPDQGSAIDFAISGDKLGMPYFQSVGSSEELIRPPNDRSALHCQNRCARWPSEVVRGMPETNPDVASRSPKAVSTLVAGGRHVR